MEETLYLYLVRTISFRAYVVAPDTEIAFRKFQKWLEENDYGYFWDRNLASIEVVAETTSHSPKSADGNRFDDGRQNDKLFI